MGSVCLPRKDDTKFMAQHPISLSVIILYLQLEVAQPLSKIANEFPDIYTARPFIITVKGKEGDNVDPTERFG
ncbi:hypothetical protein HanPSC8_Chr08g0315011 [Helianthus annuus]|nr:hypothetical protein HanPSC8_Chr08g0315011 [Helianthus annuus]